MNMFPCTSSVCRFLVKNSALRLPLITPIFYTESSNIHITTNLSTESAGQTAIEEKHKSVKIQRRQKLHKRILNEDEITQNREHLDNFRNISHGDLFGIASNDSNVKASPSSVSIRRKLRNVTSKCTLTEGYNDTQHLPNRGLPTALRHCASKKGKENAGQVDRFGLLSSEMDEDSKHERLEKKFAHEENDGEEDHRRLSPIGRRHPPLWYGKKIEEFGRLGKIREAITVFDTWMLKNDRVMPTPFCFTVLMGILGRAGYTKKCFQLFNQMKKMGLKPQDPTYTALFNACANSPWKSDGLSRATKLHSWIHSIGYIPTLPVYHAMLKAYSRCGETIAAFRTMDELHERYVPTAETYSFLLMACCADTQAGFLHAIQVWRRMRDSGVTPDIFHYNLLLRCVRDCGIGHPQIAASTLTSLTSRDLHTQSNERATARNAPRGEGYAVISGEILTDMSHHAEEGFSTESTKNGLQRIDDYEVDSDSFEKLDHTKRDYCNSDYKDLIQLDVENSSELSNDSETRSSGITLENMSVTSDNVGITLNQSDNLGITPNKSDNVGITLNKSVNVGITLNNSDNVAITLNNLQNTRDNPYVVPDGLNALTSSFNVGQWISSRNCETANGRLLLFGGLKGFLDHLGSVGVAPDIKTFTLLVDVIARTTQEEDDLMDRMDKSGSQPDVDFFNLIVEKRVKRSDYDAAKAVLSRVSEHKLYPNLRTFGCLALGCKKKADGIQFLRDIELTGLEPNIEIYEILVYHSYTDFSYTQYLLRDLTANGLSPSEKLLASIESAIDIARKNIVRMERSNDKESFYNSNYFQRGYREFSHFYPEWLKRVNWRKPAHPWDGFRQKNDEK